MPNTIELNLLENRSIVAKMQGYPLANENSYKIIAGEENATIFKVVSIPNQYADKSFTIEMVNAKGYGIEETPIVNITNYEFSLPVGMAVAGYAYVLFRAKYTENGKEVVVPFQPLKVKVWNTLPEWKEHISNSTNVRIENGYLIINEDGKDYNLGYVKGEKGDSGDIASQKIIDDIQKEISDLYLLSNATVTGTEEITDRYTMRQTANGLNGLIDGALTKVTEIKGSTVRNENLIPYPYKIIDSSGNFFDVAFWDTHSGIKFTNNKGVITANGTATADIWFRISVLIPIKNTSTYYLSGCPTGGSLSSYFISANWRNSSDTEIGKNSNDYGNGVLITPTEELSSVIIYIRIKAGTTITNEVFKPLLVEAETGIWTPPFTDLKHAYIKAIKSTGRNLFDKSKAKDGYEIVTGATGAEGVNAEWFVTNLIPIIPNTRYTITGKENGDVATQYDVNKKPLGSSDGGTYGFTTYSNAAFVKLNGKLIQKDTFQLEIGATASEYTPYTEEIYQLPQPIELGEWDSFNPQTGEVLRQTGTITIKGNEQFERLDPGQSIKEFYIYVSNATTTIRNTEITGICNRYTAKNNVDFATANEEGVTVGNGAIYFIDPNYKDEVAFKTYLAQLYNAGTPVIVSYKLDTPTIEKIENAPKLYKAWKHGSENVIQGDIDNSEYGAKCAITQIYAVKKGVSE